MFGFNKKKKFFIMVIQIVVGDLWLGIHILIHHQAQHISEKRTENWFLMRIGKIQKNNEDNC
jgi:hypothetical protein